MDSVPGGSAREALKSISRRELINFYKNITSSNKFEYLVNNVCETLGTNELPNSAKQKLSKLIFEYKSKWEAVSRTQTHFERKHKDWLDSSIDFWVTKKRTSGGAPSKNFEDCSERSKRRKTEKLRNEADANMLVYAAQMKYRSEGLSEASRILKDITNAGPEVAKKYVQNTVTPDKTKIAEDKALSLLINANLTKFQYNTIRSNALEEGCNIYPNYEAVTRAKQRCYPDNILITETTGEVPLQDLLNHTTNRLAMSLEEIVLSLDDNIDNISLISKWGFDGSSGQSEYKQCFQDPTATDASLFVTSLVPVKLVSGDPDGKHITLWQNPRSSSPRFCRPIRLQFVSETTQLLKQEADYMTNQVTNLTPTVLQISSDKTVSVDHRLILTMVDGKAINAVTSTSSNQRCNLCSLTSKDFNSLNLCLNKPINESILNFGMSTLHCWIRFYEWLLHLSYKLKLCKWQARGNEDKRKVETEKKRIQEEFKSRMGLVVDKPKHGFGSSNDGNTARRFFEDYEVSSEITGINKNLIYRSWVILLTVNSGFSIDEEKFKIYCLKTAVVYLKLYPWYLMPTTVHRVLIHGYEIIKHAIVPIGLLSEDAQETKNKDIKMYRRGYTRKMSRSKTMEDLFHRLLVSSDPYITSLRKTPRKSGNSFPPDVLRLLKEPVIEDE